MGTTIDRAAIARAVADAHVPTLMLSLAHLTGDANAITKDNWPRYALGATDMQGRLPADLQDKVRAEAVDIIAHYMETGAPELAEPSLEMLRSMMEFAAGAHIPERYVPFLREQLQIDGVDAQRPQWSLDSLHSERSNLSAVIVGAGMSGLLMAMRLRQAGIAVRIFEKNDDLGGTWYENSYPGCRVDSSNYTYSYSFEPNFPWPQLFSRQDSILDYFRTFADKYGLRDCITFNASVDEAVYDEARATWRLQVTIDGKAETIKTPTLIAAVGQLNRPQMPDIEGIDSFTGPAFHTAQWRHDVDLAGKRVAVIGTGASAFQVVPSIAPVVGEMHVFQRSAPWLLPTPEYHEAVPAGMQWLLETVPFYEKWYRFYLFWLITDGSYDFMKVDPDWQGDKGAIGALNAKLRDRALAGIRAQLPKGSDLLSKVVPDYHFGGKRAVRDNGVWLAALEQDNVHLVTDRIAAITPTGIRMADDREIEVDVIIYGTGFQASRFLLPMRVIGRDGIDMQDKWEGDARAYLGVAVPEFPNFFMLYGPNTNIVVNGSVIFMSECATRYIMGCYELMLQTGSRSIEVRQDVYDLYNDEVDAMSRQLAWGAPGVSSWYKNANGRVTSAWPFRLVDYWERTLAPQPGDFVLEDEAQPVAQSAA